MTREHAPGQTWRPVSAPAGRGLAGGDVPQNDGPVAAARRQQAPVGAEANRRYSFAVTFERRQASRGDRRDAGATRRTGSDLPQLDGLVVAGGGQRASVGAEGHPVDFGPAVRGERGPARARIPARLGRGFRARR